jgi:hypothetical protein
MNVENSSGLNGRGKGMNIAAKLSLPSQVIYWKVDQQLEIVYLDADMELPRKAGLEYKK